MDQHDSTASSSPNPMMHVAPFGPMGHRKIGAGTCGTIFCRENDESVLKVAKGGCDRALQNDYIMHTRILEVFEKSDVAILIPKIRYWVEGNDKAWWAGVSLGLQESVTYLPSVLSTERIPTVPTASRINVIDRWCPTDLIQRTLSATENSDCLLRLYCGARRTERAQPLRRFSLRNYGLTLDHLEVMSNAAERLATVMGEVLALMHFEVGIDARDVEFVLGGWNPHLALIEETKQDLKTYGFPRSNWARENRVPDSARTHMKLWMLDFNQCRSIKLDDRGIKMATDAFYGNDPYFPRPVHDDPFQMRLWHHFESAYLSRGQALLQRARDESLCYADNTGGWFISSEDVVCLPHRFIDSLVTEYGRRSERRVAAMKRLARDEYRDDAAQVERH